MKTYKEDTVLTFGKFNGKTILQVAQSEPGYIDWCAKNLEHFYLSDETIANLKRDAPKFRMSIEGSRKMKANYLAWEQEQIKHAPPMPLEAESTAEEIKVENKPVNEEEINEEEDEEQNEDNLPYDDLPF